MQQSILRKFFFISLVFIAGTLLLGTASSCSSGDPKTGASSSTQNPNPDSSKEGEAKGRSVNANGKVGCIEGDCENGEGTYVWEDGSSYRGAWQNGKRHGNGVYYWSSGDRYQGQFVNGDLEGNGIYIWANGARYDGEWKAGKIQGRGTYTWPNGHVLKDAEFENHKLKVEKTDKQ